MRQAKMESRSIVHTPEIYRSIGTPLLTHALILEGEGMSVKARRDSTPTAFGFKGFAPLRIICYYYINLDSTERMTRRG
jgi:hypothetical protein